MPTKAGWLVAIGAVTSVVAGRLLGVVELYVLGAAAGLLVAIAIGWVWRPLPELQITRRLVPAKVVAGDVGRVELHITNVGRRGSPAITLLDPVEGTVGARLAVRPLRPGASLPVGYRLPTMRRGPLRVGPLVANIADPFGLATRAVGEAAASTAIILPAVDHSMTDPTWGTGDGRSAPKPGMDDLVTLRPYAVGDDLRRVHWPSSAHADELLVRRDEDRWRSHRTVVLDTSADVLDPAGFERAVSAAAGIVHAAAEAGDQLRLATTAGPSESLDTGMVDARRSRSLLMEHLALVRQHPTDERSTVPAPDRRSESAVVLITGERDAARNGSLAADLRAQGFATVDTLCPPPARPES